ncbi:OmpA family protein [candidate division KSB1 bacterium]|nr:OmpA family protein [candidate division KSB1 bacterium]
MKSKTLCRCIVIFSLIVFTCSFAEDPTLIQLQDAGYEVASDLDTISCAKTLNELHNWFDCRNFEHHRENILLAPAASSPNLLIPIGIYPVKKKIDLKSRWEFKLEYATHLQTANIGVGYYRELSDDWFVIPYAALGAGNRDVSGLGTPVTLNLEGGADFGYYLTNRFALVAGGLYNWVDPRGLAVEDGTGIAVYGGVKYFLTAQNQISLNLKAGQHFWSGFNGVMPPNFFARAGISLYRSASMAKVVGSRRRPVEVGLIATSALATANLKVLLPFALRQELSIAPFASYGLGTQYAGAVNQDLDNSITAGLELRLFGKQLDKFVNPYIGAKTYWINYEANPTLGTAASTGNGWAAYLGTRIKLYESISLDINVGPAFWGTGFPIRKPDDVVVNGGLVVALGKKQKVAELCLNGKILTKKLKSVDHIPEMAECNPLTDDMLALYDGEIRTYVYREAESTIFGNLTDLKFIEYFGMAVKFEDVENAKDVIAKSRTFTFNKEIVESPKMIVVMFNNKRINIEKLKKAKQYLSFLDYNSNRYFGFYYDETGTLQPEYLQDLKLGQDVSGRVTPEKRYMGCFDDYVIEMKWLDDYEHPSGLITPDGIKEAVVEKFMQNFALDTEDADLKQNLIKEYDFAYAVCDNAIIENINNYLQNSNLGYAVLAAKDFSEDGLFKPDAANRLIFDTKDDFVFSNHEKIVDLFGSTMPGESGTGYEIMLDKFAECDATLTESHKNQLNSNREQITGAEKIEIVGFTDESKPTTDCLAVFPKGNPEIALARATSVATYLIQTFGVDAAIISVAEGKADPNEPECPKCRKAMVTIKMSTTEKQLSITIP